MAATAAGAVEKRTHPGAGAMERAPKCAPGLPGPQSLARPPSFCRIWRHPELRASSP